MSPVLVEHHCFPVSVFTSSRTKIIDEVNITNPDCQYRTSWPLTVYEAPQVIGVSIGRLLAGSFIMDQNYGVCPNERNFVLETLANRDRILPRT